MDVATKSNTGDWESVACPDNYQLLEGLLCGGHGGSKNVYAMCGKRAPRAAAAMIDFALPERRC